MFLCQWSFGQADFTSADTLGCSPHKVVLEVDLSTVDLDTVNYFTWYLGRFSGDTLNTGKNNPDTILYADGRNYTVGLSVNGNQINRVNKVDFIKVNKTVQAIFEMEDIGSPNYQFIPVDPIEDTAASYQYLWSYDKWCGIDDPTICNTQSNTYNVNYLNQGIAIDTIILDTGAYNVKLRIIDDNGCADSSSQRIVLLNEIVIPNVFNPETQGLYEIVAPSANTILSFKVFSRTGLLVFNQEARHINWDGRSNSGQELNEGVYFYILEAVEGDPTGVYTKNGFVHIFR